MKFFLKSALVNLVFMLAFVPAGNYTIVITSENLIPIKQQITVEQGQTHNIGIQKMDIPSSEGLDQAIQKAINNERSRWDSIGDNKKGLPEAIDALKTTADF